MSETPDLNRKRIKETEQNILNLSFDDDFDVQTSESLGYYAVGDILVRIACDSVGRQRVVVESATGIASLPLPSGAATEATLAHLAYMIADSDDDASPNYFGFLRSDGAWYIMKETIIAGANTYRYAKGTSDYTTNWTGRAALSYDYWNI